MTALLLIRSVHLACMELHVLQKGGRTFKRKAKQELMNQKGGGFLFKSEPILKRLPY